MAIQNAFDNMVNRRAAIDERRAQRGAEREARRAARQGASPAASDGGSAAGNQQTQAFDNFYNSMVYQFPLQQGLEAINSQYAARGALESGAAQKAIGEYVAGYTAPSDRDWETIEL